MEDDVGAGDASDVTVLEGPVLDVVVFVEGYVVVVLFVVVVRIVRSVLSAVVVVVAVAVVVVVPLTGGKEVEVIVGGDVGVVVVCVVVVVVEVDGGGGALTVGGLKDGGGVGRDLYEDRVGCRHPLLSLLGGKSEKERLEAKRETGPGAILGLLNQLQPRHLQLSPGEQHSNKQHLYQLYHTPRRQSNEGATPPLPLDSPPPLVQLSSSPHTPSEQA